MCVRQLDTHIVLYTDILEAAPCLCELMSHPAATLLLYYLLPVTLPCSCPAPQHPTPIPQHICGDHP